MNKVYENDDDVASFPYHFEIRQEEDGLVGEVRARIWTGLQIEKDQIPDLEEKLRGIPAQKDSGFFLEGNEVVYRSKGNADSFPRYRDAEIDIRRHFIEDYLEAERDLTSYVKPYHAKTLKTEFLN